MLRVFLEGVSNMDDASKIEKLIIEKLQSSGLIERFSLNEFSVTPNINILIELMNKPQVIYSDECGIFYNDENGEKVYCPEFRVSIEEKGEWISDHLPSPGFDIYQNGNVRKAKEAEALYCTIIIANTMKGDLFKEELSGVFASYDFENMLPHDDSGKTFQEVLNSWVSYNSIIVNILISASKYRMSDTKKDIMRYLKDGISESLSIELRDLEIRVKHVNSKYSEGELSPNSIKQKTKIERLQAITSRDEEITKLVMESNAGLLYRILRLSSEYIPPERKKAIENLVIKEVNDLIDNEKFKNLKNEKFLIISKIIKNAINFEKILIRKNNVSKYIQDPISYKLPSKQ